MKQVISTESCEKEVQIRWGKAGFEKKFLWVQCWILFDVRVHCDADSPV